MAPDVREKFLVREYPSDSFDRMLKTHRHPLDAAGLDAEEKAVRAYLQGVPGSGETSAGREGAGTNARSWEGARWAVSLLIRGKIGGQIFLT